jgi:hypothetical protein
LAAILHDGTEGGKNYKRLQSEENEIGGIYLMRHFLLILTTLVITLLPGHPAFAQGTTDLRAFEKRCTSCHGNPSMAQAPTAWRSGD